MVSRLTHHIAKMRLRFKTLYVIGPVMVGFLLLSFHRFNYKTLGSISTCVNSLPTDGEEEKCNLPTDYIVDSDHVSYPWIGDPTCKHFPVQVSEESEETNVIDNGFATSLQGIKPGPSGL